ncbi:hypothetical protein [Thalassococcus sp. BH17M4-6]|uniref:hypothetical protein n=1 Tax=Thalassococcus sp. BH17M4-6 TaxID=3413148 RepID=UPI003BF51796
MVEQVVDFSLAALEDIKALVDYLLPYCFLDHQVPFNYRITIDPSDLGVDARVIKEEDQFNINVSAGMVLSVDTASSYLCRMLFPNAETLYDNTERFRTVEPLMLDYSFILNDELTDPPRHNLIYAYPVTFMDKSYRRFQMCQANFALVWIVLHEVAHIQLDHFSEKWIKKLERISASDAAFNDGSGKFKAMELCADIYANVKFFSTFYRKDALEMLPDLARSKLGSLQFLMLSGVIPCMLMHRMQLSFAGKGTAHDDTHPDPRVRLYNLLGCVTPALDNNVKFLRPVLEQFGQEDFVVDVSLQELTFLTSNATLLIDDFLKLLHAIPLWPWPMAPNRTLTESGSKMRGAIYGELEKGPLLDARSEISSAIVTYCLGAASFSETTKFGGTHQIWKSTIEQAHRLIFGEQVSEAEVGGLIRNMDMSIFQTHSILHEIVSSQSNFESNKENNIATTRMIREFILRTDSVFAELREDG